MDEPYADVLTRLKDRKEGIRDFLKEESPECFSEQKHTDSGTPERIYWHYGYMVALKDVLALLEAEGQKYV